MSTIAENLQVLRQRVHEIARRAGRVPEEILVVAVSKTFQEGHVREAHAGGQEHFGENYAQEFRKKSSGLHDLKLKWHFIGHLQSNKAKDVVGKTFLVHSLDRLSLAEAFQKRAETEDTTVDALVEVHTTDEATKSGVMPEDVDGFVKELAGFDRIRIRGLMTMGPFTENAEDARPCFRQLVDLQRRLRQDGPAAMSFDHLSMGMSSDYHVAIEEGATIIRIGTAIFGQRSTHGA